MVLSFESTENKVRKRFVCKPWWLSAVISNIINFFLHYDNTDVFSTVTSSCSGFIVRIYIVNADHDINATLSFELTILYMYNMSFSKFDIWFEPDSPNRFLHDNIEIRLSRLYLDHSLWSLTIAAIWKKSHLMVKLHSKLRRYRKFIAFTKLKWSRTLQGSGSGTEEIDS